MYSVYAALGFFGMGLGAGIAALPSRLQAMLPGALAYRPLFLIIALASVACCGLLWLASDIEAGPRSRVPAEETPATVQIQKHENTLVRRLMIANLLNGVGIGATGPLIAYWFALRFGQGPGEIGPLLAGGFVMAGLTSFATGWLSRQIGIVPAVVAMRLAGLAMLVALPFAPSFGLAGALYVLRGMLNRGTTGARSALNVSIVRPQRRGLAASMANVSMQAPRAVAPVLTGALFGAGDLGLPFFIAAAFQGAYVGTYYWAFRKFDPRYAASVGSET